MRVSSCGKTLLIGTQCCEDEWRLCHSLPRKAVGALLISTIMLAALQLLLPNGFIPAVAIYLGAAVLTALALLVIAQLARVASHLLGKPDAGFVVVDANRKSIVSYTGHLFGAKRRQFSFDDVSEVSGIRQRWNGQSHSSGAAIKMYSGYNIIIPDHLDSLELMVLGYFIGLQGSSLELRPA